MVRLTHEAASLIQELVRDQALPGGAGLRIAQRDDHDALAMVLSEGPGPEDRVITLDRAVVFLGPIAEQRLDGAVLDARHGELGRAFFVQP